MRDLKIDEVETPYRRNARFYDPFFSELIRDPDDLPFIDLMLKATLFVLPLAAWIMSHKDFPLWVILPYFLAVGFLLGPFILMVHNTCHRKLFKRKYSWLNLYIPWVLSPFFGLTPETYYSHHVGMHHPENNLEDDLSSTLRYRRDSFFDFSKYFARFFFLSVIDLPRYFLKRNRHKLVWRSALGELSFYFLVLSVAFWNWKAAGLLFAIPFFVTRFMMMNGNWAQHAFVDLSDPANNYKNSITCINSLYNRRCFNDGYHIIHHLQPTCHWQKVPYHLSENRPLYANNDAVIFEKIDYFIIWIFLMLKRYDWLAKYFVDLNETPRSPEEIMALLKSRTKPLLQGA